MSSSYIVKDINLADFGKKEILIAETEMPGLIAIVDELSLIHISEPTRPY